MKQKTIQTRSDTLTITMHDENDYSIAFDIGDYSVRGTGLDIIRSFAEWQQATGEQQVTLYHEPTNQDITNPWLDPSGRFELTCKQSADTYGVDNVISFIHEASLYLFH